MEVFFMVLTPKDIQDKNFRSQIRGYDRNQVDGFLDQIIQDYSQQFDYIHDLEQQLKTSQKDLSDAQQQISYFNELQNTVNESIIVAQNAADQVKGQANIQAQTLLKQTRARVEKMVDQAIAHSQDLIHDAKVKAQQLVEQTQRIQRQLQQDYTNLQSVAQAQQSLLQSTPWQQLVDKENSVDVSTIEAQAKEYLNNLSQLAYSIKNNATDSQSQKQSLTNSESEKQTPAQNEYKDIDNSPKIVDNQNHNPN